MSTLSLPLGGSSCIQLAPIQTTMKSLELLLLWLQGAFTLWSNIEGMPISHTLCQCVVVNLVTMISCRCRGRCRYRRNRRISGSSLGHLQLHAIQGNLGVVLLRGFRPAEATDMFVFVLRGHSLLRRGRSNYRLESQRKFVASSKHVDEIRLSMRPPNVSTAEAGLDPLSRLDNKRGICLHPSHRTLR